MRLSILVFDFHIQHSRAGLLEIIDKILIYFVFHCKIIGEGKTVGCLSIAQLTWRPNRRHCLCAVDPSFPFLLRAED